MTQVIDASALLLMHLDSGERGEWARRLIDEGELVAPMLIRAEVANALRRMVANNDVSQDHAVATLENIISVDIALRQFEPYVQRVWQLRHNASAYDAWYLAIAEDLDCRLVTGDRRISSVPAVQCEVVTPPRA